MRAEKQTRTAASTCCATSRRQAVSCDHASLKKASTRSNRRCKDASGLRLCWPRPNNRRRAVVCSSPEPSLSPPIAGQISNARFVHTSNWDIELHHSYMSPSYAPPVRKMTLLSVPDHWSPSKLETGALDDTLFEYFCCVASASLATFGHDGYTLGDILVRVAMQEVEAEWEGETTAAVLQALLAYSSLHRYGLQSQALELKTAALGSLAKGLAAAPELSVQATIQHVAAGMLLCSFEAHGGSCTTGQWSFYLGGVKTVLTASPYIIKEIRQLAGHCEDVAALLDWVHYHDVLLQFSLLHWKREAALSTELLWTSPTEILCAEITSLPQPLFSLLNLLSQVCDVVSSGPAHCDTLEDYQSYLSVLDWRIRSLPISKAVVAGDDTDPYYQDARLVLQLYQLAVLLFFNRSVEDYMEPKPARMQQHIDKAFSILPQLQSGCKPQFPIFIVGCEARTDEQRAVVLDVIERTEKTGCSRSWNYFKRILQATWAQDDLANGNSIISYRERLTLVMSHCQIVPSFV